MFPVIYGRDWHVQSVRCFQVGSSFTHDHSNRVLLLGRKLAECITQGSRFDGWRRDWIQRLFESISVMAKDCFQYKSATSSDVEAPPKQILRHSEEITDTDRLPFKIFMLKES